MTVRIYGARLSGRAPTLASASLVVPLPPPAATADLRQWCTDTQDQIGSRCVGEGFSDAHWIVARNAGKRISPLGIYTAARARERTRAGEALVDVGSDPADAVDALVTVGAYPRDVRDDNPADSNDQETWPEAVASQLFSVEHFLPIEMGDMETVDRVLASGMPVVNWMPVDESFMKIAPGETWQGMTGPSLGGHCTVICAKPDANTLIIFNSYGVGWASGGFAPVARSVIAKNAGLCGLLGGPVFA